MRCKKFRNAGWIFFDVNHATGNLIVMAAKLLNLDDGTLWTELENGKSIAEIAEARGVDSQMLINVGIVLKLKTK